MIISLLVMQTPTQHTNGANVTTHQIHQIHQTPNRPGVSVVDGDMKPISVLPGAGNLPAQRG